MKKSFLFIIMFSAIPIVTGQNCNPAASVFCEAKKERIGAICHQHKQGGTLVYFDLADGSCVWCPCSCVASNTPIAVGNSQWAAIGDIKVGDKVLALAKNNKWVETPVTFSDGTKGSNNIIPYAIYVKLENGSQLITTSDHIFLLADKKLKRADNLSPDDKLMNKDLKPVKIIDLYAGEYRGYMHNVTVGNWGDGEKIDFDKHFVNTNGIISGDFYIQSTYKDDMMFAELEIPILGTPEYYELYKHKLGSEKMLGIKNAPDEIKFNDNDTFRPYKPIEIPDNAINFLPKEYERSAKKSLLKLDNSVPYEVANYLIHNYKRFYPDVIYHLDWADDVVNAYAWKEGNTRHIAIKGGLIRNIHMKQEGLGLVIAHELGHHYGGGPRYSDNIPWASCEGQADYWGALICQRVVWWGPYALEQIEKGSQQVYNLFAYGLDAGNLFEIESNKAKVSAKGICSHPPATCRLFTYRAAAKLEDKPSCAGDPPTN